MGLLGLCSLAGVEGEGVRSLGAGAKALEGWRHLHIGGHGVCTGEQNTLEGSWHPGTVTGKRLKRDSVIHCD